MADHTQKRRSTVAGKHPHQVAHNEANEQSPGLARAHKVIPVLLEIRCHIGCLLNG
jgi:hypothetical protein